MLEYLRNASEKMFAKILMGILIFSFVGWGVAEWVFSSSARDSNIATVGKTEISVNQYNAERAREISRLSNEQQKQLYKNPMAMDSLNKQILSNLTNRVLVINRANDLGFIISDKQIAAYIRDTDMFQENGKFSENRFARILAASGLTESEYANMVRQQFLGSMVTGGLNVPVRVPEFVVQAAYNSRYGKKSIEYVAVNFEDFKVSAQPTDEQLREFYNKNPKTIPEYRKVSYVLMPANMDAPDSYDRGYKAAQKMEDDIISGESLANAAKKNNAKFVALPEFTANNRPVDTVLTDSVMNTVFSMDEGIESEMLETKKGFVIIRVEKIIPQHTEKFESVRNNLIAGWKIDEQKKQSYIRANELLTKLNEKSVLDSGKKLDVARTSGAPIEVLVAAFSNPTGTKTIVPAKNAFYVLHIEKDILPKMDAGKMSALRKELEKFNSKAINEDYDAFLSRKYPVEINEKLYNKMYVK